MTITVEDIGIAGVVVAAVAVVVREVHAARLERKRAQPVVIVHEFRPPIFNKESTDWLAVAFVTNDGSGNAFNARFGIEIRGVRFPFRMNPDDPPSGNRITVVRAGETTAKVAIRISSEEMFNLAAHKLGSGDMDETRVYWARYENAEGKTWETLNPGDRSANLDIRRRRWLIVRELQEARRRKRAARDGRKAWARHEREMRDAASDGATPDAAAS